MFSEFLFPVAVSQSSNKTLKFLSVIGPLCAVDKDNTQVYHSQLLLHTVCLNHSISDTNGKYKPRCYCWSDWLFVSVTGWGLMWLLFTYHLKYGFAFDLSINCVILGRPLYQCSMGLNANTVFVQCSSSRMRCTHHTPSVFLLNIGKFLLVKELVSLRKCSNVKNS